MAMSAEDYKTKDTAPTAKPVRVTYQGAKAETWLDSIRFVRGEPTEVPAALAKGLLLRADFKAAS